ncbi:MAG: hypothetical protein K0R88_2109 [Solirubrobacterales bacterium]|jgi:predicted short-subunit dehydrogenase-like oxidoreductase (DUF2520 family)|nr:hypothetical protein [Solirubrobacterales bacterium]
MRELERDQPTESATAIPGGRLLELPPLAIVGAGRVGRSLAGAARRAGLDATLAGREDALAVCRDARAALLCVPDDAIAEAAGLVADAIPPLELVGHTSGASGLDALAPAAAAGAATFSLHPLQTIPDGRADFTGCPGAISGSAPVALGFARTLADRLGMRPFEVAEEDRGAYHAAASIASNFLVALQESAAELLGATGAEDARELLSPLVLRTAANWSERGADALTGPIARGDEETVARHLEALRERAPELLAVYEVLAERTRALAARRPERAEADR